MADLLKLDDTQREQFSQWMGDLTDFDPNNAFAALGKATGIGKYPKAADLEPTMLDHLARKFGYTTDRLRMANELQRDQSVLLPFVEKSIAMKMAVAQSQAMAPPVGVLHQQTGVPYDPSQLQRVEDAGFIGPMPWVRTDTPFNQGMSPQELQQPYANTADTREQAYLKQFDERNAPYYVEGQRTDLRPNESARPLPWQMQQADLVQGGKGIYENGAFIPMPLAKPYTAQMTPTQIVEDARLQHAMGNLDADTLRTIESQVSGGLIPGPQPAANVRAGFTAASSRVGNTVSVAEQRSVLRNMVEAGQLDGQKYQAMEANLTPMNKTVFDTFVREMTGGANNAITKGTNELAEALFGKPYDQLGPDEQVTPDDRKVFFEQFNTALPHGPMTRRLALSRLKVQDIPKNIQQFKTEEQIRAAGPVTYNRGSAEMDLPLGGSANKFRRLTPTGEIETAPTTMSHRTANELGFVDTTAFKQDVQAIPDLDVLESQTRELEKYATELIKADSGIGRFVQGGKIAINKLTQGGKPTTIPRPDGLPGFLTVGEAANLYETQVQSMLEYYARNLRGVRGAATEGDVGRMQKAFASVWDSKATKEQKFKEVHDFIREVKDASLKTVFGKTVQHIPDLGPLSDSEAEFASRAKSLGMSKATVAEEIQRRRRR